MDTASVPVPEDEFEDEDDDSLPSPSSLGVQNKEEGDVEGSSRGLQVRRGIIRAEADFTEKCSYAQAYELFCSKEEEELEKKGIPKSESRLDKKLKLLKGTLEDIKDDQDEIPNTNLAECPVSDSTFCLYFDAPHPSYTVYEKVTVNDCLAAFSVHNPLEGAHLPRPGSIPFLAGERHSLAEFDHQILPRVGEQWDTNLLVGLPISVLRKQLLHAFRSIQAGAQTDGIENEGQLSDHNKLNLEDLKVGVMAFSLSVAVHFALESPRPTNSPLYFVTHTMRRPDSNKICEIPFLVTTQRIPQPMSQRTWFPTIPYRVFSSNDSKGKHHYRIQWKLEYSVPEGFTVLAPGRLVQTMSRVDKFGRKWEDFHFETRSELEFLLPSQLAFFAGPIKVVKGDSLEMFPFAARTNQSANRFPANKRRSHYDENLLLGALNENEIPDDDFDNLDAGFGGSSLKDDELKMDAQSAVSWRSDEIGDDLNVPTKHADQSSPSQLSSEKHSQDVKQHSLSFAVPAGFEILLRSTLNFLPKALRVLDWYLQESSCLLSNVIVAFLPVGNNWGLATSKLTSKKGGLGKGEGTVTAQNLTDGGGQGLPCTPLVPTASIATIGSQFWVFGNLVVLSTDFLHSVLENHEGVIPAKLAIFEAILGVWFGNLLSVIPSRMSEDYWLAIACRKYITWQVHMEAFGRINASVAIKRLLDSYCNMVETGDDRLPLSSGRRLNSFADFNPIFHIKCSLVLIALECLLVSTSKGRNWLNSMFFKQHLSAFIQRQLSKFPNSPLSSEKFLAKLRSRVKAFFIKNKLHISAVTKVEERERVFPDHLPDSMLDPSYYRGHPKYDIGEVLDDITNFNQAFIVGTGCPQNAISIFCELQKKSGTVDTFKARIDQIPLQPPREACAKDRISSFIPAVMCSVPALNQLLAHPDLLFGGNDGVPPMDIADQSTFNHAGDSSVSRHLLEHNLLGSSIVDDREDIKTLNQLKSYLLQCSNALQFLEQAKFDLESTIYHPLEMIVRENRSVFGFGYLGSSIAPICGGRGPLFNGVLKHAVSTWTALTPEQRNIMASDTAAMETFVASTQTNVRIPTGSVGGYPTWLPNVIAWHAYRHLLDLTDLIPNLTNSRRGLSAGGLGYLSLEKWIECVRRRPYKEDNPNPFSVELPESSGAAKFWPSWYRLRLYEENRISEEDIALRAGSAPNVFTLKDPALSTTNPIMGTTIPTIGMSGTTIPTPFDWTGGSNKTRSNTNREGHCILGILPPNCALALKGESCRFLGQANTNLDTDFLNVWALGDTTAENIRYLFLSVPVASAASSRAGQAGFPTVGRAGSSSQGALQSLMLEGQNDTLKAGSGSVVSGSANNTAGGQHQVGSSTVGKALPILWTSPSSDSFNISRQRRFQSVSMWANQLLYDPCPFAQIEAVDAIGSALAFYPGSLSIMLQFSQRPKVHPWIRGLTVYYMAEWTKSCSVTQRQAIMDAFITKIIDQAPMGSGAISLSNPQTSPEKREPWIPPLFATPATSYLTYLMHAIALLRNDQNETPENVIKFVTSCIMSLPSPLDIKLNHQPITARPNPESFDQHLSFSYFVASVILAVRNFSASRQSPASTEYNLEELHYIQLARPDEPLELSAAAPRINPAIEELFSVIWRWVEMEKRFPSGRQYAICSFLMLLRKNPDFLYLTRKLVLSDLGVTFDPLRFYVPIVPPCVLMKITENPAVKPLTTPDSLDCSYLYLENFISEAKTVMELQSSSDCKAPLDSIALESLATSVTYASGVLNYVDLAIVMEAIATYISLIIQGRMIPPSYLNMRSTAEICECSAPSFGSFDINKTFSLMAELDPAALSITSSVLTVMNCEWVDDFSKQQFLMRSGLAVLSAIKFVAQLEAILPFADMAEVVAKAWKYLWEGLENAVEDSPLAILPFCLFTDQCHLPVFKMNGVYNTPGSKRMPKKDRAAKEKKTKKKTVKPSMGMINPENPQITKPREAARQTKIIVPSMGVTVVNDNAASFDAMFDNALNENDLSTWHKEGTMEKDGDDEFINPAHSPDFDDDFEDWLNESVEPVENQDAASFKPGISTPTDDDAPMENNDSNITLDGDLMFEPSADHGAEMMFDSDAPAETTTQDDERIGTSEENPSFSIVSDRLDKKKRRRKGKRAPRGETEHQHPFSVSDIILADVEMLVPPVLETFDLLMTYLHSQAPAQSAYADRIIFCIREIIHFLFGSNTPRAVNACCATIRKHIDELKEAGLVDASQRLEAYINANWKTLATPVTDMARLAAKHVSRAAKAGILLRHIPSYEKTYISIWSLSKRPNAWPLPIIISFNMLAQRITQCLMEHPAAIWFINPVDSHENPSYYRIIEQPMWLNKIIEKVKNREYENFEQWRTDLFRIFRNCRIFNAPQTVVVRDCDNLQSLAYQLLCFADRLLTPFQHVTE